MGGGRLRCGSSMKGVREVGIIFPSHAVGSARAENNAARREAGEQSGAIRCGAGEASHPRRKPGLSTRPSVVGGMDRLGERNTGRVQDCLDAAAHCEKRAASAGDLAAKNAFVAAAICWRDLAQCWQTYSTGMHACSSRRNATNSDGLPVFVFVDVLAVPQ